MKGYLYPFKKSVKVHGWVASPMEVDEDVSVLQNRGRVEVRTENENVAGLSVQLRGAQ